MGAMPKPDDTLEALVSKSERPTHTISMGGMQALEAPLAGAMKRSFLYSYFEVWSIPRGRTKRTSPYHYANVFSVLSILKDELLPVH